MTVLSSVASVRDIATALITSTFVTSAFVASTFVPSILKIHQAFVEQTLKNLLGHVGLI